MAVIFIDGLNRSIQRKLPTFNNSLTNHLTLWN